MITRSNLKELADFPIDDFDLFKSHALYLGKTNRLFFNDSLIYKYLRYLLGKARQVSILDIGTGAGDIPRYLAKKLEKDGIQYSITGMDNNSVAIQLAREKNKNCPNVSFTCEKVENLSNNYNVAIASQMLHHLGPEEAVSFLKSAYQKVSRGIIISDLICSNVAYYLIKSVVYLTTTNKIDRSDGPLSVLRCYSDKEIKEFLNQAGINNFRIHNIFPRKFVVIEKA